MKIKNEEIENVTIESPDTQIIDEIPGKHDCHWVVYITKIDGKFYRFSLEYSYNNGIQFYDDYVDLEEVKPVEKVVTEWVKV